MNARRDSAVRSRTRACAGIALAVLASLVIAGCGAAKESSSGGSDEPEAQKTQAAPKIAAVWPLTGLPGPEQAPTHPVMIVKIDNTYASEPQRGLGKADMVVEELVEGGITRLATMFYSELPPVAGPVRSMRASDIGIVKPTHAVLVASGAAPPTYGRLNAAKVVYKTEGAPGMYRDHSRHAPYNLFMRLPELTKSLKQEPTTPANYLPWGAETDFVGVAPASSIEAKFSNATRTKFAFDPATKKYTNVNTHAGKDDQFKADSVLVLRVREGDAGYKDPAGNPVPEALFVGTGNLALFHNGQVVRGTWTKDTRDSPLVLATTAGPLKVPAGHVWIELLPRDDAGGQLTFAP